MGKIIEVIMKFINPVEPEKSFEELALASGIGAEERDILKKSMNGLSWKFDDGDEEPKKTKKTRTSSKGEKTPIQAEQKLPVIERKNGFERDD